MNILSFIAGAMLGGLLGVIVMCLCVVSGNASRQEEQRDNEAV